MCCFVNKQMPLRNTRSARHVTGHAYLNLSCCVDFGFVASPAYHLSQMGESDVSLLRGKRTVGLSQTVASVTEWIVKSDKIQDCNQSDADGLPVFMINVLFVSQEHGLVIYDQPSFFYFFISSPYFSL